MGYIHIDNLYKDQRILLFKRCWALEKIHGTSARLAFRRATTPPHTLTFASGGENHTSFVALFDVEVLRSRMASLGDAEVVVYGEAYGGKQQGMSGTYGPDLRFIVFDIMVDDSRWLSVLEMVQVATHLGLEHVPFVEISTDLVELDRVRDMPSEVAARRLGPGAGPRRREGVVLRPLVEFVGADGRRVIAKHKLEAFSERASPQKIVDPAKLAVLSDAAAIAQEWVTPMRLEHVLDTLPGAHDVTRTREVIEAMAEDVLREAAGEIVDSKEARAAIGRRTAELFKVRIAAAHG